MDTIGAAPALDALLPSIRARRDEIERQRRLPADLARDLRSTGIFRLAVPRALGGEEADPLRLMHAIETVAAADGSAGWCVMIGAGNNIAAGYMKEAGAREVFADPSAPTAGAFAPAGRAVPVTGGVRITGRWPFASGITHCDWVWVGCMVMDGDAPKMTASGPEIVHACVPIAEVEVHDTWYVSGLCGSGSHDISIADAFVPEHRIFKVLDPADHRPEPLYQMPPVSLFVFQLVCVSLGVARSALTELVEMAGRKVPSMRTGVLADTAVAQVQIARAEAALGAARSYLFSTAEEMWRTVSDGRLPSRRELAVARIACTHAVETAADVARTANTLAGGASIYSRSSLQRHARDAEAITHHFTVTPLVWEDAGRVLLGREPLVPVI